LSLVSAAGTAENRNVYQLPRADASISPVAVENWPVFHSERIGVVPVRVGGDGGVMTSPARFGDLLGWQDGVLATAGSFRVSVAMRTENGDE
jgi:hypothetical protein